MMENNGLHQKEKSCKCTGKVLIYPDGSRRLIAADRPIFGPSGWELSHKWDTTPSRRGGSRSEAESSAPEDIERAQRRARSKIRDYALCNDFKFFVTLTLDGSRIERYDPAPIVKHLQTWLDNHVRRQGLKYILIPERHRDGALHFHGFFNDALTVADSGTVKQPGRKRPFRPGCEEEKERLCKDGAIPVYNLPAWRFGFSTAIPLYGNYHAAVGYVCKYIGKGSEKIGGRWYFSGGGLKLPEVAFCDFDVRNIEAAGGVVFDVPAAGMTLGVLEVSADDFAGDGSTVRPGS